MRWNPIQGFRILTFRKEMQMSLKGNLSTPNAITLINFVWMTVVTGMLTATAVLYDNSLAADGLTASKASITAARYYDMGYSRQQ
jgi:hypothetical protein